ncbi:MAG: UDP-N-acetylmuramoyl-L-alanyl-D-glutamate--2,6-diaminopimelate ligase [Anaerolineales bacterium]|nr:UDP-N-acetylmuramoyl-L-alanyl-D-glutamate--2,6-diaminopimelate ligase [Anaerolineales bacterium]
MLTALKKRIPRRVMHAYHFLRALVAVTLNGYPARKLTVIGVTGTDGKTTTSHLIYHILHAAGQPVSLISTTGAIIHGRENQPLGLHVTTPNPFELQNFIKTAVRAGSKYLVLESTSHGLAQYRVWGSNYQIGVVTNITREHLDYHGSYEQYLKDKARLLKSVKTSILNRDDSSFEKLKPLAGGKLLTYGLKPGADVTSDGFRLTPAGPALSGDAPNIHNVVITKGEGMDITIPRLGRTVRAQLVGDYNAQNILAATSVGLTLGLSPDAIAAGIKKATPPPGRLQRVDAGQPFTVFVDFAHTPNSLENVLKLLRGMTKKRLIVVFGCAGLRDPYKRHPMGTSAGRYADLTVITAEDPRTESLDDIMAEVAKGVETQGKVRDESYFLIGDRQKAIQFALDHAQPGDIVVTCGKAHEQSMCFGTVEYPWDEFQAVKHALGVAGVEALKLPTYAEHNS